MSMIQLCFIIDDKTKKATKALLPISEEEFGYGSIPNYELLSL